MNSMQHLIVMAVVFFIVIPVVKSIWAFITKEDVPANPAKIPEAARQVFIPEWKTPDNEAMKWWKENMRNPSAFMAVETMDGSIRIYTQKETPKFLHAAILNGTHNLKSNSFLYSKEKEEGEWTEKEMPLKQIIDQHFKLRKLYSPRWAYALSGLKWGALIGIALKLLDTAIGLFAFEPGAGLCFLAAVGICFIPRVGIVGVIVLTFVLNQFYNANFFIMGLSAALSGAILGCLPGMAIGGMIAIMKTRRLQLAPDAGDVIDGNTMKTIVLPFIGAGILLYFYFYIFNPWLMNYLA